MHLRLILGCTALEDGGAVLADAPAAQGIRVPVIAPLPRRSRLAATLLRSGPVHARRAWPQPPSKPTPGCAA